MSNNNMLFFHPEISKITVNLLILAAIKFCMSFSVQSFGHIHVTVIFVQIGLGKR